MCCKFVFTHFHNNLRNIKFLSSKEIILPLTVRVVVGVVGLLVGVIAEGGDAVVSLLVALAVVLVMVLLVGVIVFLVVVDVVEVVGNSTVVID